MDRSTSCLPTRLSDLLDDSASSYSTASDPSGGRHHHHHHRRRPPLLYQYGNGNDNGNGNNNTQKPSSSSSSSPVLQVGWSSLPSPDVACIYAQALLHFLGIHFEVVDCDSPLMSPSETLPFLRMPDESLLLPSQFVHEARLMSLNFGMELSEQQEGVSIAFRSLIERKLVPALQYYLWCEPGNYSVTRKFYGRLDPFPLNHILPYQEKNVIVKSLLLRKETLERSEIYDEANQALSALSEKLGKQPYFFGSSPTEIDALLFAVLILALKAPMPVAELRTLVSAYANLREYTNRIYGQYFCPSPAAVSAI